MNSHKGFTLLELIISIAIIGIIVLIVTGAASLGSRAVDSGEKKIEHLERIRMSLNIIDSQLQSEIPLTYEEDANRKLYFLGETESIRFATNYSIWGGQKGYVIVTYKVKPDISGKKILYASENIIGLEGVRETKLLDNLDNIYFEYFYKDPLEEEGEGKWVEQLTDTDYLNNYLPEKVKLHLVEGKSDFSIIIPLRMREPLPQTSPVSTGLNPITR